MHISTAGKLLPGAIGYVSQSRVITSIYQWNLIILIFQSDEYENSLRKDLLLTKKRQLLVSGIVINDEEVEQAYKRNFEKIELEYVFFDPKAFFEKTNVTDDQLRTYYQKNKEQFKSLNK